MSSRYHKGVYLLSVFEILKDLFCISLYCVSVVSLRIESTDSMILGPPMVPLCFKALLKYVNPLERILHAEIYGPPVV